MTENIPDYPADFEFAALLISNDRKRTKWVVVPDGQKLDAEEGFGSARPWLSPHTGSDYHLQALVSLRSLSDKDAKVYAAAPELLSALIEAEYFIGKLAGGGETDFRAKLIAVIRAAAPHLFPKDSEV